MTGWLCKLLDGALSDPKVSACSFFKEPKFGLLVLSSSAHSPAIEQLVEHHYN